jgi:hypothetical protein
LLGKTTKHEREDHGGQTNCALRQANIAHRVESSRGK